MEESFASIDVDGEGKKGADAKPRLVREDREEEDEDAAAEDWSYKVCSALPKGLGPHHSNRQREPFQIPEPPSGFKDDSLIQKKTRVATASSTPSSSSSTSGHESPITVGETKPVLPQQDQQQPAVAVSNDSGTELSSDKSDGKPNPEVTSPPPPATANGNSEADDTYSYCSGLNLRHTLLYLPSHLFYVIF